MSQQIPVVLITVELARQLLVNNKINRKIKPAVVNRYAHAMALDQWPYTGDTIKTDEDGNLLDGQHRLLAIIKSGKPQRFGLVGNLPRAIFDVLDTGKTRQASDVIHSAGTYQSSAMVASAARYLVVYERTKAFSRHGVKFRDNPDFIVTNHDVLSMAVKTPEIAERQIQLAKWMNQSRIRGIRRGLLLAVYIIMLRQDLALAESFMRRVLVGEDLKRQDPEYLLRSRFIGEKRIEEVETAALTIKAWNAKRQAKPIGVLRWNKDEKFPEIF